MVDWDRGTYEDTATELAPAAEHVVQLAGITKGDRVLDIGTGTGNAALLAARAGADVTAVDPSPRLLDVARQSVGTGEFTQAKAEALPFTDRSFDRVLSLFAVIFTDEPQQAASEILRVLKRTGKALITAWQPTGAMHEALGIFGEAMSDAAQAPQRDRFPWGEPDRVRELFDPDADVAVQRATLSFERPSAEAFMARFEERHPAGIVFKDVLTRNGTYEEKRAEALAAIERHNEAPTGLRVSSSYLVFTVAPRAAG